MNATYLDYNISNSSIRFEQFLNISVSGVIRDVSKVNFIVSHLNIDNLLVNDCL